jgi:hypothetical protein
MSRETRAIWSALGETERRFLLAAYDVDRTLPHTEYDPQGFSKVIPPIKWRSVGAVCGLTADESDALVTALAARNLVLIANAERRQMGLIAGHYIREVVSARRERVWNWVTVVTMVVAFAATWFYYGR